MRSNAMRSNDEEVLARLDRIEERLVRLCEFCSGWTDLGTPDGGRHYHPPGDAMSRPRRDGYRVPPDSGERLLEGRTP